MDPFLFEMLKCASSILGRYGKDSLSQVWCYTSVIPALGSWRQEDLECESSWGYTVRFYLKRKKKVAQLLMADRLSGSRPREAE
jgi:hypothetical protein